MDNTIVKAQGKYIRQSPYKMRLVLNLIRGLDVQEALNVLTFTKREEQPLKLNKYWKAQYQMLRQTII